MDVKEFRELGMIVHANNPDTRDLREEDYEFEASVSYTVEVIHRATVLKI